MDLQSAQRLVRLVGAHGEALKRARSLERRILLVLVDNPEDGCLRKTTLAALNEALSQLCSDASVDGLLAGRERREPNSDDDEDTYNPAA